MRLSCHLRLAVQIRLVDVGDERHRSELGKQFIGDQFGGHRTMADAYKQRAKSAAFGNTDEEKKMLTDATRSAKTNLRTAEFASAVSARRRRKFAVMMTVEAGRRRARCSQIVARLMETFWLLKRALLIDARDARLSQVCLLAHMRRTER